MLKRCYTCKVEKEINNKEFHKDKNRKDGFYPNCRKCRNTLETIKYREKHLNDILEYARKYRETNHIKLLLKNLKRRAISKGLLFNLVEEDLIIPTHCPILGIPLKRKIGKGRIDSSPSVDRIDNTKGYTKDNIIIVSWRANNIKGYATIEELEKITNFYKGIMK